MNTTSKNVTNVEASSSPFAAAAAPPAAPIAIIAGRLSPWRRGGPLTPGSIAKFRPRDPDRWIAGAKFRVDVGRDLLLVQVERYKPAEFIPACIDQVRGAGGRYFSKGYPAHTIPELVVVVVLAFEPKRDAGGEQPPRGNREKVAGEVAR